MKVPAGREDVRQRRPAHERGEQPAPAADRLHRAAEEDHCVRRRKPLQRAEGEFDLPRAPLVLDRPRWQPDFPEPVPNRLERVADTVKPHVGQELIAPLEHLDLGRRTGLALADLLEPDLRTGEPRDVELDLEAGHVPVPRLAQPGKLGSQLRPPVEGHRSAAREVDVADHPPRAVGPREHAERGRIGHDHDVGEPGELVDPEAAALHERGREHPVARVEAVDRAREVGAVVHGGDCTGSGYVLAACDSVLVDENEAHRPQPELLDARGDAGHCMRLLVGVQAVPLDEAGRSEAKTQTVAHGCPRIDATLSPGVEAV